MSALDPGLGRRRPHMHAMPAARFVAALLTPFARAMPQSPAMEVLTGVPEAENGGEQKQKRGTDRNL